MTGSVMLQGRARNRVIRRMHRGGPWPQQMHREAVLMHRRAQYRAPLQQMVDAMHEAFADIARSFAAALLPAFSRAVQTAIDLERQMDRISRLTIHHQNGPMDGINLYMGRFSAMPPVHGDRSPAMIRHSEFQPDHRLDQAGWMPVPPDHRDPAQGDTGGSLVDAIDRYREAGNE